MDPIDKKPNFDNELKRKAFDHSKDFLKYLESFIEDVKSSHIKEYYEWKTYTFQFTLDGVKLLRKQKKDDNDDLKENEDDKHINYNENFKENLNINNIENNNENDIEDNNENNNKNNNENNNEIS